MPKVQTTYVCSSCGRHHSKMMGKCAGCGEFGTLVSETIDQNPLKGGHYAVRSRPVRLSQVGEAQPRLHVDSEEVGRVLGGGLVVGSSILLGGQPGIGKSTLLIAFATQMANRHGTVLYVTGEESQHQVSARAARLGLAADDLWLIPENNLETILDYVQQYQPKMLIVDSIQTLESETIDGAAGNPSQVEGCARKLTQLAKSTGLTVFIIGHLTKEGEIAGTNKLQHIVDTVLLLKGDPFHRYRLLYTLKNRFGATSEVGVFEMTGKGLVEVNNPSALFLQGRRAVTGSVIGVTMEGTRPLLVEVQALLVQNKGGRPLVTTTGVPLDRVRKVAGVLEQRCNIPALSGDLFVNVVGGLTISEPAVDLPLALAIASSHLKRIFPQDMVSFGEIGLGGEIRPVSMGEERVREAARLGFSRSLIGVELLIDAITKNLH